MRESYPEQRAIADGHPTRSRAYDGGGNCTLHALGQPSISRPVSAATVTAHAHHICNAHLAHNAHTKQQHHRCNHTGYTATLRVSNRRGLGEERSKSASES